MFLAVFRANVDFCGWLGLISNRALEATSGHGLLRARFVTKSEGLERSEVLTRWVRTSVPARNKPRQDPQNIRYSTSEQTDRGIIREMEIEYSDYGGDRVYRKQAC